MSDPRAVSEVWLVSILLKLYHMGVTDPDFMKKIEKLIENNIDRFVSNALIKLVILVITQDEKNPKYKDLLLRKLRSFNPENVIDVKM